MDNRSGIYLIESLLNDKVYVGSAKNFAARWRVHRSQLKTGTHHSKHLQRAWNQAGPSSFVFKRILLCRPDDLIFYEDLAIAAYHAADRRYGFNILPKASSRLGVRPSVKSRAKMSASAKAHWEQHPKSPEQMKEMLDRMAEGRKRKNSPISHARREQLRQLGTGRVASAETKALLSRQRTGRKMPGWFGEFVRQMKTGTKHTDEAKRKIGLASSLRKASLETRELRAKITYETAKEIRELFATGDYTQTRLAERYGIHQSMVSLIVAKKRWCFEDE